jgi:hypothetical protein
MPNVLHHTEEFNHAYWTAADGLTVSANAFAAPAFAGGSAGLADTLTDPTGANSGILLGTDETIPADSSDWTASLYVRKDADSARFPMFVLHLSSGTAVFASVSFNTVTGAIAAGVDGTPDASGVVDVDSLWWRLWWRKANNGTGNNAARLYIYAAHATSLGGSGSSTPTGDLTLWGAQLENASVVGTYVPDPFYTFSVSQTAMTSVRGYAMNYVQSMRQ